MAYCRNCGAEIDDNAVICVHCGAAQNIKPAGEEDAYSVLWALLGFFIPIVGLILYLVWRDTKPKSSKAAGLGALISVGVSVGTALISLFFFKSISFGILGLFSDLL